MNLTYQIVKKPLKTCRNWANFTLKLMLNGISKQISYATWIKTILVEITHIISETFLYSSIVPVQCKWNRARLILPEVEYTSYTWTVERHKIRDLRKWENLRDTSKLIIDIAHAQSPLQKQKLNKISY